MANTLHTERWSPCRARCGTAVVSLLLGMAASNCRAADDHVVRMRERIDELIADRWSAWNVQPAPECTDSEFLRRAYLDLVGRIPRVSEVRDYLRAAEADRRLQLIDQLVLRPTHATHVANAWRRFLLPEGTDLERVGGIAGFETWLRMRIAENIPYDQLVRELLLAEGDASESGPALFFTAWELKSEKLAASTSRAFLGLQLQCAECHDHPFEDWTQQDFWGYAAFFARLQPGNMSTGPIVSFRERSTGEVTLPETEQVVLPRHLDNTPTELPDTASRREALANWIIGEQNPYFARAAVNRIWSHLFGRGIVEPLDDMGPHNPPSHPALLDELSEFFKRNHYDVRLLVRTVAGTKAYGRSSQPAADGPRPEQSFAQMAVKTMTAEQLYDSLATATCKLQPPQLGGQTFGLNRVLDQTRQTFLNSFRTPTTSVTEYQLGIAQVLTLMNGNLVSEATNAEQSDMLVSLSAPFFSDQERVETIFLAVLARKPTPTEQNRALRYVTEHPPDEKRQALGDLLWALVNSSEFTLNR